MNTSEIYAVYSTSNHLLSRVIRFVTKSKASHCSLWLTAFGVPLVLQASVGGVKFACRDKWLQKNKVVKISRFKVDVSRGISDAISFLNDRYDYVALLGYIPVMIARWFGRAIQNPLASAKAQVCSEFLLHVDAFDEVPEWNDLEWDTTTPQMLMECEGASFDDVPLENIVG